MVCLPYRKENLQIHYTTCYASVFLKNRLTAIAGIKNIIMKLKFEDLAPYLPYEIDIMVANSKKKMILHNNYSNNYQIWFMTVLDLNYAQPILRPLSDLTNTIFIGEDSFMPLDKLLKENCFATETMLMEDKLEYIEPLTSINFANYNDIKKLLSWHFDVFGLIEKGLAVNINDIKN